MGFGQRFDDNQSRPGLIALVQFGINGASECFRIVGDDRDTAEQRNGRDMGVGDDVDGGCWMLGAGGCVMRELGLEIVIVFPGQNEELGSWGVMFWELAGAFEDVACVLTAKGEFTSDCEQSRFMNHSRPQQARRRNGYIQHR